MSEAGVLSIIFIHQLHSPWRSGGRRRLDDCAHHSSVLLTSQIFVPRSWRCLHRTAGSGFGRRPGGQRKA